MPRDIDERLFHFAGRAIDIYVQLVERGGASRELGRQFLRAATAVGANAAEASAGQTKADFLAKIGVARKECREALFWLRLFDAKALLPRDCVTGDIEEARQIAAVLTAIVKKGRKSGNRGDDPTTDRPFS